MTLLEIDGVLHRHREKKVAKCLPFNRQEQQVSPFKCSWRWRSPPGRKSRSCAQEPGGNLWAAAGSCPGGQRRVSSCFRLGAGARGRGGAGLRTEPTARGGGGIAQHLLDKLSISYQGPKSFCVATAFLSGLFSFCAPASGLFSAQHLTASPGPH